MIIIIVKHCSINDSVQDIKPDKVYPSGVMVDLYTRNKDTRRGLHDLGYFGRGVTIAILDSGVWCDHPMLSGRARGDGPDRLGHGTMCACLAAGSEVPNRYTMTWFGHSRLYGMAPRSEVVSIKIIGDNGEGTASGMARGIDRAVEEGVDIINISAGQLATSVFRDPIRSSVSRALRKDIIICAAVGNNGKRFSLNSPARLPGVIAVTSENRDGEISGFASRGLGNSVGNCKFAGGDGFDGEDDVEWIYTGTARDSVFGTIWPDTGPEYVTRRGTSLSCAYASGYAAVLLEAFEGDQKIVHDIMVGKERWRLDEL